MDKLATAKKPMSRLFRMVLRANVEDAGSAFGVHSRKGVDNGDGTYLVEHTATIERLVGA